MNTTLDHADVLKRLVSFNPDTAEFRMKESGALLTYDLSLSPGRRTITFRHEYRMYEYKVLRAAWILMHGEEARGTIVFVDGDDRNMKGENLALQKKRPPYLEQSLILMEQNLILLRKQVGKEPPNLETVSCASQLLFLKTVEMNAILNELLGEENA